MISQPASVQLLEIPSTWEAVATLQLLQSAGLALAPTETSKYVEWLRPHTGVALADGPPKFMVPYASTYRRAESSLIPYIQTLAKSSGITTQINELKLDVPTSDRGDILLCPYSVTPGIQLSYNAWKHVTQQLRSYGQYVLLLGDTEQRLDSAAFMEDEILSNLPTDDKLAAIANAKLIVGMPNAWVWLGAALHKKMIVIQPDNVHHQLWSWYDYSDAFTLVYEHDKLQIPMLLTGVRQLIARM